MNTILLGLLSVALLQGCAVYPVEGSVYYGSRGGYEPGYSYPVHVYETHTYGAPVYRGYEHRRAPPPHGAPRMREAPAPERSYHEPSRKQPEPRRSVLPMPPPPAPPLPITDFGRRGPRPISGH